MYKITYFSASGPSETEWVGFQDEIIPAVWDRVRTTGRVYQQAGSSGMYGDPGGLVEIEPLEWVEEAFVDGEGELYLDERVVIDDEGCVYGDIVDITHVTAEYVPDSARLSHETEGLWRFHGQAPVEIECDDNGLFVIIEKESEAFTRVRVIRNQEVLSDEHYLF